MYPEEGVIIWIDNFIIPKGAKNKREAELFLNFINEPEINAEFVKFCLYATPNREARKLFSEEEYKATTLPDEFVKNPVYWEEYSEEAEAYINALREEFATWGIEMY